jgi:hypothetical protein
LSTTGRCSMLPDSASTARTFSFEAPLDGGAGHSLRGGLLTSAAQQRAEEAGRVAGGQQLLGVGADLAGRAHLTLKRQLQVEHVIGEERAAVTAAGGRFRIYRWDSSSQCGAGLFLTYPNAQQSSRFEFGTYHSTTWGAHRKPPPRQPAQNCLRQELCALAHT